GPVEVGVELAGVEAAEANGVPEGAGDVAAELVTAIRGEGNPAFESGEEDGKAGAGGDMPEADRPGGGGGGEEGAVRTESNAPDRGGMALETMLHLACPWLP